MSPVGMRVMQVIAPGPAGGAETVVVALAAALQGAGTTVVLAALVDASSGPFVERARAAGLLVEELDAPGRNYARDWSGLRRLARTHRVQLIHTHGYRADVLGLLAARAERLPSVATAHGFTLGGRRNRLNQWVARFALQRHDAVIAVSEPLAGVLQRYGVSGDRIALIRNAWTPSQLPPLARDAARAALGLDAEGTVLGWVGRLSPEKGADIALEAMALVKHDAATLVLLGEGRERRGLEARVRELGLERRVRFQGLVPDAARFLPAFGALVLSSRTEGTPMVLLEAASGGVPIVATDVGGVSDVVAPGTGLLVPPGSPARLAAAIDEALDDPVAAQARAHAAMQRIRTVFNPGAWLSAHLALYARVEASMRTRIGSRGTATAGSPR